MPSILFINRVYPPDDGATGLVLEHVACGFVRAGWDVSILASSSESRRGSKSVEIRNGVSIHRTGASLSKKNLLTRAIGYALMIPSLLLRAARLLRADVVVTMTDPPMLLVAGPFLHLLKGSRTIHWAQDLYPEVAEVAGVFRRGGILAGLLRRLSTASMRSHGMTIAVGRCMEDRLKKRGISPSRISVIPNTWVERGILESQGSGSAFRERHGLGNSFIVEYSGNMGVAHEFQTVLEAAKKIHETGDSGILFLFVGGGPRKARLAAEVARLGIGAIVKFLPSQPAEHLPESLAAGDLHLVTMREEMSGLVVPSKFYGVMAAGRPCLFVGPGDSEVGRVICEKQSGDVIPPGDSSALVAAILKYRDSPELMVRVSGNARIALQEADSLKHFIGCASGILTG